MHNKHGINFITQVSLISHMLTWWVFLQT